MSNPNVFLVLAFDHPLRAVESVAERMAAGLAALGLDALALSVPRDADRIARLPAESVCGVLSLGPLPLGTRVSGRPLWEHFDCPFTVFTLDAVLYDIARVPVMRSFIGAAQRDRRLGLASPERGYRDWLGASLGVRWDHLPFAAFPRVRPNAGAVTPQQRVAVIGTIGGELGGTPVGENLPDLLQRVAGRIARVEQIAVARQLLSAPDAPAMPAAAVAQAFGWSPARALDTEPLAALIAIDSWVKRQRRIDAVKSLAGVPVDFYGSGWQEILGPVPGFQYVGRIHHDDIAIVLSHYRCAVNFDPNWTGGVHDRVYTAAAMGTHVFTNENTGLAGAGLPEALLTTYNPNRPALAALVHESGVLLRAEPQAVRADVLARHNWATRMATWLAAEPMAAAAPEAAAAAANSEVATSLPAAA